MKHIDKLVMELQQKRDELVLQIHLDSKAAQQEWSVLEQKWEKFASDARLENSADNISAVAGALGNELKAAYKHIKKAVD